MRPEEKILLTAVVWAIVIVFVMTKVVFGQATTITVDISKASLVWTWTPGTGGPLESWRIKCGPKSTDYTITREFPIPAMRSIKIMEITPDPGTYFCVVVAANKFGQSGPGPEVNYEAGKVPGSVASLVIQAQ